ncbi:hypothetical protein [Pyrodictium abyssi]|uniref:Uncharacterized protein n=1 Tax=Pyrodictium abyssi TaxID=54256 RepID=A0ABM8ISM2_9CREN|nr:hypothetical protein PABY_01210 [Pyrodictium abyssi]
MGYLGGSTADVYSFAVYYFFWVAITVFAFGTAYRLAKMVLLWRRVVKAEPRNRGVGAWIIGLVRTFVDPIIFSMKAKPHDFLAGLVALHIVGVLPLIFLLAHHVAFFAYWFAPYKLVAETGLWIPLSVTTSTLTITSPIEVKFVNSIWGPLTVILNGDVLAILAILGVAFKIGTKVMEQAHGLRHVRWSDYFSLGLLMFILLTGYAAARHSTGTVTMDVGTYRTVLGFHILGAEILLMLIPFSKYWHFVFGYWYGKLHEWYDLRVQKGLV